MTSKSLRAAEWIEILSAADGATRVGLERIYVAPALIEERRLRICNTLRIYLERFGDEPVRIFRAPGRINLRGMHVDTHGGWLNLMTHQREVMIIAGLSSHAGTEVVNTDSAYESLFISEAELPRCSSKAWDNFITSHDVQARVASAPGHWRNYIEGAWLRARHAFPDARIGGLRMVVDSNLPQGAALSSSAALCIALLQAWIGWTGLALNKDELILAAQDAEWYTGSRCGTCDQAAIILGQPNAVIHTALHPGAFTTAGARALELPDALRVLAINSYTRRSISGAEKTAYTLNRFAYSMAMTIFQQALRQAGYPEETVTACGHLSSITPEALGGNAALYRVMKQVPERLTVEALCNCYVLPQFDHEYTRYFGDLAPEQRPREIGLRGPLLFGIAESERARHFALAIDRQDYTRAGQLMTVGHDGDRRVGSDGKPFISRVDDASLDQLAHDNFPIEDCPGCYGASSPALDRIVDSALDAGALGASLTGAGIAGTVLALCRKEDLSTIVRRTGDELAGGAYQRLAGFDAPLSPRQRDEAVLENCACMGASELAVSG